MPRKETANRNIQLDIRDVSKLSRTNNIQAPQLHANLPRTRYCQFQNAIDIINSSIGNQTNHCFQHILVTLYHMALTFRFVPYTIKFR